MAFHDEVLADLPLFHLRCNELSGTVLADASGGEHHGTLVNRGGVALGQSGMSDGTVKAVGFTNGMVRIPNFAGVVPSGDYSIELVARWGGTGIGNLFGLQNGFSPYTGPCLLSNWHQADGTVAGALTFRDSGSVAYAVSLPGSAGFNDNAYRHVVCVRRGLDLEIWINGTLVGSKTVPSVLNPAATVPVNAMGRDDGSYAVGGGLDELVFYHHALSAQRIARHYVVARDLWKLAGSAKLDTGAAASKVVARNWLTREHKGETTPSADGSFELFVPNGAYDVTVFGPAGYQPVTHGPVNTVES